MVRVVAASTGRPHSWPALVLLAHVAVAQEPASAPVTGLVRDARGPVTGARVRIQATEVTTTSDRTGAFTLPWPIDADLVTVTAWASGHYVGSAAATRDQRAVTITLKPHHTTDNPDYPWFSDAGASGSLSCSHCMPSYVEWQRDAHSRSSMNPRFLSMYAGTDLDGNQSPPTRFREGPSGERTPVPPTPGTPDLGPGFKLDHPTTAGSCGACHAPVPASRPGHALQVDPRFLTGVDGDGVSCELCHKAGDVILDPATGLPFPDRPGVLSMRLFRPPDGEQLFFGQFDDVARRVSYLPLIEQSAFCAPCHHGVFEGVTVYDSFGEWLASPYSDPKTGKTCQACHMLPAGYDYFVYPEKGGLRRNAARILGHQMPGAESEELLRNAVSLHVESRIDGERLVVTVRITNDKTGHHVPTDSPLRHLILLVAAHDPDGTALRQVDGPTVPEWGGVGDPRNGYYAGLPGKAFAKVLQDAWTGASPTGAYWRPTRILSDNRLAAFAADESVYSFALSPSSGAQVEVKLLFRRAFRPLADLKRWPDPDIEMVSQHLTIEPESEAR